MSLRSKLRVPSFTCVTQDSPSIVLSIAHSIMLSGPAYTTTTRFLAHTLRKKDRRKGYLLVDLSSIACSRMTTSFDFTGKKALVTGASQGIGYGIAMALAETGAKVVALARDRAKLEDLSRKHSSISVVSCDVTSCQSSLATQIAPHQPFDFLVNNAGVATLEPLLSITEEAMTRQFEVNLKAPIVLAKIVADQMIRHSIRGVIVNISSQASIKPLTNHTVYCASKAGLDMVTRCMAKELGQYGIRVNSVNPTVVMTEMGRKNWSDPNKSSDLLSQMPMGRFAEVEDVVKGVLFLLSDASAMTTGEVLPIDGGFTRM